MKKILTCLLLIATLGTSACIVEADGHEHEGYHDHDHDHDHWDHDDHR